MNAQNMNDRWVGEAEAKSDDPSHWEADAQEASEQPNAIDYAEHAIAALTDGANALPLSARSAVVRELLLRLVDDVEVFGDALAAYTCRVQGACPEAFAEFCKGILQDGGFAASLGPETASCRTFVRLANVLRFQLQTELDLVDLADFLLLDTGLEAFIQFRVLYHRATTWTDGFGPSPREEERLRAEAREQRRVFLKILDDLRGVAAKRRKPPEPDSRKPVG